jgi:uncharacterized RDD family membrane protein YckC
MGLPLASVSGQHHNRSCIFGLLTTPNITVAGIGTSIMDSKIIEQLINLGFLSVVSVLVWRYYRSRSFPLYDRYLTFGPRFWAGPIDQLVTWPVGFLVGYATTQHMSRSVQVAALILENAVWVMYSIAMHAKYGQTIGKMMCKVRFVDYKTENPISVMQAVIRDGVPAVVTVGLVIFQVSEIVVGHEGTVEQMKSNGGGLSGLLLAGVPILWFVAELITMMTNDKRRALHDLIAGTVVVRTKISESVQPTSSDTTVNEPQVI